jgi:predicted membrane-bound spermidine synthase
MKARLLTVFVFFSGCSALVYQVAWLRLLRLIFGTSTAATAAVMAVFLGGLGLGALMLGGRADKASSPIRFYAKLELGVAVAAALSPALIALIGMFYLRLGGTPALGLIAGTALRLFLSALVLGVPTFLMGGTLPAVARALGSASDQHRRSLGVLYGMNTLGAVVGTLLATFIALEKLGVRATIWSAALLNLMVALAALSFSRRSLDEQTIEATENKSSRRSQRDEAEQHSLPRWVVLSAAGIFGFVFLLMELVWYRMLTPLLGGSTYTFGLILAVALLGIGIGALGYALVGSRPLPIVFAFTCALEAFLIALPYARGDHVALLALAQRQNAATFSSLVWGWFRVTMIVVFPPAVVAGFQFPLLVGLLGRGRERVGSDVGGAYATNTLGAIVGSLAGGFGLLPLLTAPRVWQWSAYLLALLAGAVVMASIRRDGWRRAAAPIAVAVVAIIVCQYQGPTAFWRHSPIGAGRIQLDLSDPNAVKRALNERRLEMFWEADGVESAVGLDRTNGFSFDVNGKSDGSAIGDAPTQVMLGLIGAALNPNPKRALVIGLGTGETAGWLAQVPSIERVDVYELEPAMLRVARDCAPTNHNALANPKVHVIIGDARELLLTSNATYDVIASEPSNPYRAGIASLFTKEFYDAVAARLGPSGVFIQWVQAYEVKRDAMHTIMATLGSVFPSVETWELMIDKDLAFVASRGSLVHDLARERALFETEPYRSALALLWGVGGAEGFYTGMLGNADFARDYRGRNTPLNTDNRMYLEFAFARSVGDTGRDVLGDMRQLSAIRQHRQPRFVNGSLDWSQVDERRVTRTIAESGTPAPIPATTPMAGARQSARYAYAREDLASALKLWQTQSEEPTMFGDQRMLAESFATAGDPRAQAYIDKLRLLEPVEAEALMAVMYNRTANHAAALDHFIEALRMYRTYPWANRSLIVRAFGAVAPSFDFDPAAVAKIFDALREPFSVRALDITRLEVRSATGLRRGYERYCVEALAPLEPNVPWEETLLRGRDACYGAIGGPLAAQAHADLQTFLTNAAQAH